MKDIERTLFVISARTESERVPEKMIKPFANSGTCLFEIGLKKLVKSALIPEDNVMVSIRDNRLLDISDKYDDVKVWFRSKNSCKEPLTIAEMFEWAPDMLKRFDYFVNFNACNPIISIETIEKFTKHFIESEYYGLLATVTRRNFYWNESMDMINDYNPPKDIGPILETKFAGNTHEIANVLYAGSIRDLCNGIYLGKFKEKNDPEFFEIDPAEYCDIDEQYQFDLAEHMYEALGK